MTDKELALKAIEWSRSTLTMLIADFPVDKVLFQPSPTDVHALWILGHIAVTDEWFDTSITGAAPKLPAEYGTMFGYKSIPTASAAAYPGFAEVRQHFDAARQRLLHTFKSLGKDGLLASLSEKTGGFTSDPIDAIFKDAWHEGWHSGQLSSIRRALKLKPAF